MLTALASRAQPSRGVFYALRLQPHEDVCGKLMEFVAQHQLQAAAVVTAVGSVEQLHLRYANEDNGTFRSDFFEVVALVGTLDAHACHLHLTVADRTGQVTGGHLLADTRVYTTLEVVLVELTDLTFSRDVDATYGYRELRVQKRRRNKK